MNITWGFRGWIIFAFIFGVSAGFWVGGRHSGKFKLDYETAMSDRIRALLEERKSFNCHKIPTPKGTLLNCYKLVDHERPRYSNL